MGVVYKARDLKLGRLVALKFLPPEWSHDEDAKQRFVREAQAASSTDHANICTVHDIQSTDDGRLFIVMAFYEGQTLKQRLAQGPLTVAEALDDRDAGGRRAGARARRRRRAPRHQAGQRDADRGRGEDRGLRPGHARRQRAAHAGRLADGHGGLHGAGTAARARGHARRATSGPWA